MKVIGFAIISMLLFLMGCKRGGYDSAQMAALTEPERKIVGTYHLEFSTPSSSSAGLTEEEKKMMEAMDQFRGPITMECLPDKTFTMVVMNVPVTGRWTLGGTMVQLQIEKVNDHPAGDIGRKKSPGGISGWDMSPSQRSDYLKDASDVLVLDQANDLTQLQVGIDGRSLYATKQNAASLFGGGVSVFHQDKE